MYLQSNNPNNYNTVEFVSSIGKEDKIVEYRVVALSTTASFSLTTKDDYIIYQINEDTIETISFEDKGTYSLEELISKIPSSIKLSMNDKGLIKFESKEPFKILEATHRVQLLFGIYHQTFPIESSIDPNDALNNIFETKSIPYFEQGQVLYLLSRTDAICLTNARGSEESQSIAYKIHELIFNTYPIVSVNNGNWFKIRSSQLQHLKFTLADFMLEPVVLHAPLFITVEIIDERDRNDRIKNIIATNNDIAT